MFPLFRAIENENPQKPPRDRKNTPNSFLKKQAQIINALERIQLGKATLSVG